MNHACHRAYDVEQVILNIDKERTGKQIKQAVKESGYTIHEIMEFTGVSSEQAVYKWFRGDSIPSLEVLLVLGRVFEIEPTELLVVDDVGIPSRSKVIEIVREEEQLSSSSDVTGQFYFFQKRSIHIAS